MKNVKSRLAGAIVALILAAPAWASPKTVTLNVTGMTCAACPITVKKALEKVGGRFKGGGAIRKETGSGDLRRCKNQHGCARENHNRCGLSVATREGRKVSSVRYAQYRGMRRG